MYSQLLSNTTPFVVAILMLCLVSSANAQSAPAQPLSARKMMEARLTRARQKLDRDAAEVQMLSERRDAISQKLTKLNVTEASFNEVMGLLQTQRVQLIIDLAGLDARQRAVVELKVEKRAKVDNSEGKKLLLKKIVDEMENNLVTVEKQYEQGAISDGDFQKARVQLLEARLRLAETVDAKLPAVDNAFLTDVSIERIEKQARLAMVESLLKQYYTARQSIEELKQLDTQFDVTLQQRIDSQMLLNQLQADFNEVDNEND